MLVEEGFNMVSVDASDKMLKYALKSRWERRKEPAFDQWGTALFHFVEIELLCLSEIKFSRHVFLFVVLFSLISPSLFSLILSD